MPSKGLESCFFGRLEAKLKSWSPTPVRQVIVSCCDTQRAGLYLFQTVIDHLHDQEVNQGSALYPSWVISNERRSNPTLVGMSPPLHLIRCPIAPTFGIDYLDLVQMQRHEVLQNTPFRSNK